MAYKRKYARPRRYGRKSTRSGTRRVSTVRKRTYRKKGAMTTKRILNLTSTKKQDNMSCYTNVTAATPQGGATYVKGAAIMPATQNYFFLWAATARDLTTKPNQQPTNYDTASRTSSTCFMKGLRENIEIQTSDGLPWQWRRICFTFKGRRFIDGVTGTGISLVTETSEGYARVVNTIYGSTNVGYLQGTIFRGDAGSDWSNSITAPADHRVINVKYDKTITIASGNSDGMIRNYRRYHPMNKNLVYQDDESGGGTAQSQFSTHSRAGMGDYYVLDIFQPREGGTNANRLRFEPSATLYWHEK